MEDSNNTLSLLSLNSSTSVATHQLDCQGGWLMVHKDLNGRITSQEDLKYALQCTGRNPSNKSIQQYWTQYGGSVSFSQFCSIMKRERRPNMADLLGVFKRIDRNGDGFITSAELSRLLTKKGEKMTNEEVDAIMKEADLNEDGRLDYSEFCHLMLVTTEESVSSVRRRAVQLNNSSRNVQLERTSETTPQTASKEEEKEEEVVEEIEEEVDEEEGEEDKISLAKTKEKEEDEEVDGGREDDEKEDQQKNNDESENPSVSNSKPSVVYQLPSESSPLPESHSQSSLEQITTLSSASPSPTLGSAEENEGRQLSSFESSGHNDRGHPNSQSSAQAISPTGDSEDQKEEEHVKEKEEEEAEEEERTEVTDEQPDRLQQDTSVLADESTIHTQPAPTPPDDIEKWNSISGKGCFYLDAPADGSHGYPVSSCHNYALTLPDDSNVWVEISPVAPGNMATDNLLFIFTLTEDEQPSELVAYTQHRLPDSRWVCQLNLEAGSYALLPYTSGCFLKLRESGLVAPQGVPLVDEEDGKITLTPGCQEALTEIFNRIDLDSSGAIGSTEFDFFHERTSNDQCDNDIWNVVKENFEMNDDEELTLKGFLDLHVMTANDEDGGEGELWDILQAMGYNKQLQLDQACPFHFEVFTEDCEGEIEITGMNSTSAAVEPALCKLVKERGVRGNVKDGGEELATHTFITPELTTIVIENNSSVKRQVQLDCSHSTGATHNGDSAVHIMSLPPHTMKVGYHLVPSDSSCDKPYQIVFIASLILTG